jgi:hypothetical protein
VILGLHWHARHSFKEIEVKLNVKKRTANDIVARTEVHCPYPGTKLVSNETREHRQEQQIQKVLMILLALGMSMVVERSP